MTAPSPRRRPQRRGIVAEHSNGSALLILDMISRWDYPDGATLLRHALRVAPAIAALRMRCRERDVPVIYANDNSGQWRSDFKFVVREALESPGGGARIAQMLEPGDEDYFVLKPKHSAFFATPLELLLDHLRVRRLVVVGVTSDQCVAATAADARMRDFELVIPEDAVATITAARNRRALAHIREVLEVSTTPAARVRLDAA
ncbi:MAG TPA: isochorismatase family cysteine hydrolase [Burkholderiaceae bacterium]